MGTGVHVLVSGNWKGNYVTAALAKNIVRRTDMKCHLAVSNIEAHCSNSLAEESPQVSCPVLNYYNLNHYNPD